MKDKIRNYIASTYGIEPKYMWLKYPEYAVFKHIENNKWFGAIMNVSCHKLGLKGNSEEYILNVKVNSNDLPFLLSENGFLPAYHMNKNNWLSILLNEQIDFEKILFLIDNSYNLTKSHFK